MNKKVRLLMCLVVGLSGCDSQAPDAQRAVETLTGPPVERGSDPQQLALGESVYTQHCAQCHGTNGEGAPDWRRRETDGTFPPPPLNGSGHAWHHSREWLKQMILDGSEPGKGKMPAWRGQLSEVEVNAVIDWFQSLWPDQVYAAWVENQQRSRGLR